MSTIDKKVAGSSLAALPGDEVRQLLWRFADRYDLHMVMQAVRGVARGPVARAVAAGGRNTHEWTEQKNELLHAFDEAGITTLFIDPEHGGYLEGPKNLALALTAFELAWVDGGAATSCLAGNLALEPIAVRGTDEQRKTYMSRAVPPAPGEDRAISRGAFCLTEPIPYVGVDTGVLGGKVRVVEWEDGEEPLLQVDKRGRFITNSDFADFVVAAVDSDDERIKGSCLVILEESDPGTFDRGAPTLKLVHQLSSTRDPIFNLTVPASRIVGGYDIVDGVIVPRYAHSEVIEAVFRRTRITVGLMTAAKLLSSIEPIIRYHRGRFRGGARLAAGSPRHDLGLQQKEDVIHRLVEIWATGEASASLGFAAARLYDEIEAVEKRKDQYFESKGLRGRDQIREFRAAEPLARELAEELAKPESMRDEARLAELREHPLAEFMVLDSLANVFCPACKLWNTGHGANMMREAVSLMGGYGITEDCPGFIGQKWMDAQLEATYEGPEAVQRRQLSVTMTNSLFLMQFDRWAREMHELAAEHPKTGACALASAMELWRWTLDHLKDSSDADGAPLFRDRRQGVTFSMADALCWLLASRNQILDTLELAAKAPEHPTLAESSSGLVEFMTDLCHVQAARASGEVARITGELVFGYNRHPDWEGACETCFGAGELAELESVMAGVSASATDVIEEDGSHPAKAGPCVNFKGLSTFMARRRKLDGCITGSRLAKDRAAHALTEVTIPEALDYPA